MKDIIIFDVVCLSNAGYVAIDSYKNDDCLSNFSTLANRKMYEREKGFTLNMKQDEAMIIYKQYTKVIKKVTFNEKEAFNVVLKWSRLDKLKLLDKTV